MNSVVAHGLEDQEWYGMRLTSTLPTSTITAAIKELLLSSSNPVNPPVNPGDFQLGDFLMADFKTEG